MEKIGRLAANRVNVSRDEVTEKSLLRSDGRGAYPVVDGIPILLAPEMLVSPEGAELIDTDQDPYREAYEEMDFYNAVAARAHSDGSNSDAYQNVSPVVKAGSFFSSADWLDATYDIASQADAYEFISPIRDIRLSSSAVSELMRLSFSWPEPVDPGS